MAVAAHWVSQITGIALEFVVPVVIGRWLDQRWGTSAWTVVGALLGPILGFWHLLTLTGVLGGAGAQSDDKQNRRP